MTSLTTLTIAHLSDVHLSPVRGLAPWHLNVKRGLGFGNWLLKRRKVHRRTIVDALVADLRKHAVDHVIVSGDLVNLGLPGEYAAALSWLQSLGPPSRVSVVPGNHDIYCPLRRDPGVERWRAYMQSCERGAGFGEPVERGFPYVRLIGRLALVGLVSAVPTPPFYATGRLGEPQLRALGAVLDRLGREGFTRLVIVHHPPLPGQTTERRCLTDAHRLEEVLLGHGAELVVHGHNHVDMHEVRHGSGRRVDVVGVASASVAHTYKHEPLGRYNLIRIDGAGPDAVFHITSRGLQEATGPVVDIARLTVGADEPAAPVRDTP